VIGVNSQIAPADASGGNVGIGFAVPSNTVKDVVEQLVATGRVDRAYLGIAGSTITEELARVLKLPVDAGVMVERVGDGTAADRAGLRGGTSSVIVEGESYMPGGDLIVAIAGRRVSSLEELRDALSDHKPGDKVKLQIYRGNERRTVDVTLGRQPTSAQR
jgi:S1-C subfamily serine protease